VPLTGWLTQRIGQVRLYLSSAGLFVLASCLCGLAPDMTTLIACRALQGLVAGPMMPLAQTLVLASYPPNKSGLAMSTFSMTVLIAPATGPMLGGWITDNFTWPWIFFINVPVGLLSIGAVWLIYHKRESVTRKPPVDAIGMALLVIWVGALQLMLDQGKEKDWFESPIVIIFAVIAVLGVVFFLVWELTEKHPVIDLSLFKIRSFLLGSITSALAFGLFFSNVVILPLWLQQQMGYNATQSGIIMAQVGIFALILSPLVGATVNRYDPRMYATFSFAVFALVLWMRSRFNTQADLPTIMLPTLIQGVAMASMFIPLTIITISDIPPERMPFATSLSTFMRTLASAIGTSICTALWQSRGILHHAQITESLQQGGVASAMIDNLQASGFTRQQALGMINNMVAQQAYTISTQEIFYVSSLLFLALIGMVWVAKRPGVRGAGG
jgi:DHA2 family multidrug resistance protein